VNGTALVASAAGWTGTEVDPAALCLFSPAEGADIADRVGRKVSVHKLSIRGMIYVPSLANQAAGINPFLVRIICYLDEQSNGAQAQGEQLMSNGGAAQAVLTNQTFQSTANFGRFRVLKDKTLAIQNPNGAYDGTANQIDFNGLIRPFKIVYKFRKPVVVRYNGTNGGTVADVIDNSFHMIAHATNISQAPTISFQCRTVYTDA